MNNRIEAAINKQINAEFYSGYLYLSMATYFEDKNLPGFAKWMEIQQQEENFHAMKMYKYINDRGGRVILETIEKPKNEWNNIAEVINDALEHEKKVTGMINNLLEIAREEKDYATDNFLQWYIEEQVEEEATASELLEKVKMIQDSPNAIYMLDKELSQRTFTPAAE